jgi:O-antigen/teichoic acid export membrane protein
MAGIALKIKYFFTKGHERTIKVKKNIALSFFLKGISIVIGFVVIPMTINYINPSRYGIWITLSSIISWLSFFDIGLGNGLKNKLAEANAVKNYTAARIYVSTTYAVLGIISFVVIFLFYIANHFINWVSILNSSDISANELSHLALIVLGMFCIQFVAQTINVVLTAMHAPFKVSLINVIGQLISLIMIYVLTKLTPGSLTYLVLILGGVPVLIQILGSVFYYNSDYKHIAPSIKFIDFKYTKELLSLGGIFFIIQIGALVLFQTDNIVITQLFGPEKVTTFNIAYKLFSVVIMIFTILITPLWSAFTDAYAKGDIIWIKGTLAKLHKYWLFLCAFTFLLLIISPSVYKFWLNNSVSVPFSLSIALAFYVIVYSWQIIHVYFLNGIGKIKLQLYLVVISAIINIPLAIFFSKYIGVAGVTLSNICVYIVLGVIFSVQCNKVLNGTGSKIWYQ